MSGFLYVAWQLVQTPTVKRALGEHFEALMWGDQRMQSLQIAASCLLNPEMQMLFSAMNRGTLDQGALINRFSQIFSERLQTAQLLPA